MVACRKLERTDDVSAFCSGNGDLDRWLKNNGQGNQGRYGVTYVAIYQAAIVGFVTVSPSAIVRERIGGGGPPSWPVLLLGRMATAQAHQRGPLKVGTELMRQVFTLAVQQHHTTGCSAVIVDSKPEALGFYTQWGFKPTILRPDETAAARPQLYIAIGTLLAP